MESHVAKKLIYQHEIYDYSHAKDNVLIYIKQPKYYYDDWIEDGCIIVVKYKPNINNNNYIVLHKMVIRQGTGNITHVNISKDDKIAKPYDQSR